MSMSQKLDAMDRQLAAVQMKKDGMSYNQIATALDYADAAAAYNAVKGGMRKAFLEPVKELREIELARLDDLYQKGVAVLNANHFVVQGGKIIRMKQNNKYLPLTNHGAVLDAIKALLAISAHRSALAGLYAPKKIQAEIEDKRIRVTRKSVNKELEDVDLSGRSAETILEQALIETDE